MARVSSTAEILIPEEGNDKESSNSDSYQQNFYKLIENDIESTTLSNSLIYPQNTLGNTLTGHKNTYDYTESGSVHSASTYPYDYIVGDAYIEFPQIEFKITNPIAQQDILKCCLCEMKGSVHLHHSQLEGQITQKDYVEYMNLEKHIWEPLLEPFIVSCALEWTWNEKYIYILCLYLIIGCIVM